MHHGIQQLPRFFPCYPQGSVFAASQPFIVNSSVKLIELSRRARSAAHSVAYLEGQTTSVLTFIAKYSL
jgi:hypothetical protein